MASSLVLSPADLRRRDRLRRSKAGALGFLLAAAVVFVAVQPAARDGAGWAGWVSAAAEAGMVGGLADWFAVTALFRRPLGLPIPHTALIPARKDALGASLAVFVGENFLSAEVVRRRIGDVDLAGTVGSWLVVPGHARRVTEEVAAVTRGALEVLSDDDVRAVAESVIGRRLRAAEVGPVLGRLLGEVVASGSHHQLVDVTVERTARWLRSHQAEVVAAIESQAPAWSPAFVDRALARRVHAEVLRVCEQVVVDQQHPLRRSLDDYLLGLATDLREDPGTAVRLQALATRLFDHEATRDALGTLVGATRRAVVALIDEPEGELRTRATTAVVGLGERLRSDDALRAKVDTWVGDAAEHVVTRYRDEITRTITDTVERWDGQEAARRIELAAGPDLQFIRINGTVVGALAGVALHAATVLAF